MKAHVPDLAGPSERSPPTTGQSEIWELWRKDQRHTVTHRVDLRAAGTHTAAQAPNQRQPFPAGARGPVLSFTVTSRAAGSRVAFRRKG